MSDKPRTTTSRKPTALLVLLALVAHLAVYPPFMAFWMCTLLASLALLAALDAPAVAPLDVPA